MATLSITKTISAAHLARAIPALKYKLELPAGATNQQVQDAWVDYVGRDLIAIVKDYERATASKTAADAVTDIGLT